MFEKEAQEYVDDYFYDLIEKVQEIAKVAFKDGAEFGYNNANEWHFVKDGDYPKKTGVYLVAWKRTRHVEEYGEWGFNVDFFNADEGYFEGSGDFVIAWKEIVLPKENK